MRQPSALDQIVIKVPAPFAGVAELGFTARYPEQPLFQPLRDVPLWIEGPAEPMRRLADRLRMLAALVRATHGWTPPVALNDEVLVMAFQDRSGEPQLADPGALVGHMANLVRPVVFPFLHDCALVAHLRLTDRIEMRISHADRDVAQLTFRWDQIVPANGEDLLCA